MHLLENGYVVFFNILVIKPIESTVVKSTYYFIVSHIRYSLSDLLSVSRPRKFIMLRHKHNNWHFLYVFKRVKRYFLLRTDAVLMSVSILIVSGVVKELVTTFCNNLTVMSDLFGTNRVLYQLVGFTYLAVKVADPTVLIFMDTGLFTEFLVEEAESRGYYLPVRAKDFLHFEEIQPPRNGVNVVSECSEPRDSDAIKGCNWANSYKLFDLISHFAIIHR